MMKRTETWTIELFRAAKWASATIRKPGRASPVYSASRETCERAVLAAFAGARIEWVPGTHTARVHGKNGTKTINVEFVAV